MKNQFTQGSIIAHVRSSKYKDIKCSGVVISARCDLAQNKIKNFHYLTALPLENWIYEELYYKLIEEAISNELGGIKKILQCYKLDYDLVMEWQYDQRKRLFEKALSPKDCQHATKKLDECIKYENMRVCVDTAEKKKKIEMFFSEKSVKECIRRLVNGAYPKFVFIPQNGYLDNGVMNDGLVVDLQDIYQLPIEIAYEIQNNELDFPLINDEKKIKSINQNFFFDGKDDFVIIEGVIGSPWIEYVLQQFAHSFIRIGVDNATTTEISEYYDKFIRGK